MSGEPKTLTLTLEEAMFHIADEGRYRLACGRSAQNTLDWLVLDKSGAVLSASRDWEVAATRALGVPVVARDEAAELRAAVREFFKAEDAVAALHHPNGTYHDFHEAADIANTARENLRRLAGGEEQE